MSSSPSFKAAMEEGLFFIHVHRNNYSKLPIMIARALTIKITCEFHINMFGLSRFDMDKM